MWRKKKETLGSRIKQSRKDKKLSQELLARKANLSYVWFIQIEQWKSKNPSLQSVYKIAKVLDVSIDSLVDGVFDDEKLFNNDK